jgi:hypothetical protein
MNKIILFIIIILGVVGLTGVIFAGKVLWLDENIAITDIGCKDSDGNDLYTKGEVDYSQNMILNEGNIFEGHNFKILSSKKAVLDGREFSVNQSQTVNVIDDVYYPKSDGSNGIVQINVPTTILIKKINYRGEGNTENSAEVIETSKNIDQCVGNILIDNTCIRGINTGHVCENGCVDGACIK